MKSPTIYILVFVLTIIFSGCEKYLSEEPKIQASIQTAEQLEALVNNATEFCFDGGRGLGSHDGSIFSTDDFEISMNAYESNSDQFSLSNLFYYTFKTDEISNMASDAFYSGAYRQIFQANIILRYADEVTGEESLKNELKANACFIRAYCLWVLANHYCLPYGNGENENELGLTLKKSTDYNEPLSRSTLKETYEFILNDLNEALKTTQDDVNPDKPWLVSKKAIEAFLSRYYLFVGDYDEALIHTNNALGSTQAQLVDFHSIIAGRKANYSNPSVTLNYSELNDWSTAKFLRWKEFYIPRFTRNVAQWYIPSENLLSLFDQSNDLRYKWMMIPNGGRKFNVINPPLYRYTFFFDGRMVPTGPTVAEMLLNKAEILARKGDISAAMTAVNLLREKRMNNPAPLSASGKDDAIAKVLEERRRELPFVFRWYDIRRFSINDYAGDDVTVSRTFYKVSLTSVDENATEVYSLPVGSRRYAVPFNAIEVASSKNVILQNTY
ncbi:MAG: RagB/SusD family nutrient uptake outer membrane protein [Prolixibacteraceae bacterium]|nr:RagB/SusD family nutrient uptake outer membrane protein [Prolixibacteraceae bacterium]